MENLRDFDKLEVYQECRKLRIQMRDLCRLLPKDEQYSMMSQLRRSSRSVTANIAEGHGRWYYKENIAFCRKARGSLKETLDHLTAAFDEGYINREQLALYKQTYDSCLRLINGYIKYLKSAGHQKEEKVG
jgi:four helix bundle protein